MKMGTFDHHKTVHLMQLLKISRTHAGGILGWLWEWTARYAVQGDIGKCSDDQIRMLVAPEIKKGLVEALVKAKLVDRAPLPWRLIVHDWQDHAEQRVQKYLSRNKLQWAAELAIQAVGNRYGKYGLSEDDDGNWPGMYGQNPDKYGQNPDKPRTESIQVWPHARATEPEPIAEPRAEPCCGMAQLPDSFQEWLQAFQCIPGVDGLMPYKKINRGEAELAWMEMRKVHGVPGAWDAIAKAWGEFVGASNEGNYERPVKVWRKFMQAALEKIGRDEAAGARTGGGEYGRLAGIPVEALAQAVSVEGASVEEHQARRLQLEKLKNERGAA